jgi:hypothetical protein
MSRIVVTMNLKDYGAFTTVAKHPHTAKVLPPKLKRNDKHYPPSKSLKEVIRQRILGHVAAHPGETYTQVRRNVKGSEGVIVAQLAALRSEGLLRVDGDTRGLYIADTIEHEEAA